MRSLESELTVFVLSTGSEPVADCRDALAAQTCSFRLAEIVDVCPMSAAFQAMPDRCTTPFFLQVDADMILQPDAVETLHDALRGSGGRTYMVSGQLLEDGRDVRGSVKCWKRSVFRLFRFRDVRTVDRDLHRRARRLGLVHRDIGRVVGEHHASHSVGAAFLKAKADVEKWRFLGRAPEMYALPLLDGLFTQLPESRHRLFGTLLGALTWGTRHGRSKDMAHERRVRSAVLQALGLTPELDPATFALSTESDELRALFADTYSAPAGRPAGARTALAQALALRAQRPSADAVERLLATTGG